MIALQDLCNATGLPGKMALLGLEDGTRAFCGAVTVNVSGFAAGTVALSLVFGAFATEVLRGAILAVPKGQLEAARAIGMSRALLIRRILIPQVWRFALPGLGNLWLNLVKDTSLVSVIALDELMRKAGIAVGVTKQPFLFYGAACALYLAVTGVSMIVFARAERWASRGVRPAGLRRRTMETLTPPSAEALPPPPPDGGGFLGLIGDLLLGLFGALWSALSWLVQGLVYLGGSFKQGLRAIWLFLGDILSPVLDPIGAFLTEHTPVLAKYGPKLLDGLWTTAELVTLSLLIGGLLAIPVAFALITRFAPLRWLATAYIFFFRGTPLLAQIFLIYYGSGQFREFFQQARALGDFLRSLLVRPDRLQPEHRRLYRRDPARRHPGRAAGRDRGGQGAGHGPLADPAPGRAARGLSDRPARLWQ